MFTDDKNDVHINFETFGNARDPAIVLIMGLGEQMIAWPDLFCKMLADAGFYVVRFDNRDTGFSTKYDTCVMPDLQVAWGAYFQGKKIVSPYSLKDMAVDVIELLDLIDISKAYICGFSFGGMIAQNIAFFFPRRMSGLICMGSSSGERRLPPPKLEAQVAMGTPPPQSRQSYINHNVAVFHTFSNGSPLYDPECRAAVAGASYDRSFYPPGFVRQSVAMLADGSRKERLKQVSVPTLVLHGELDPVAQPVHGDAIATIVPNAKMVVLAQWGHGMDYPKLWPLMIKHIMAFCSDQRD